jgi:hypothetical protein
MRTPFSRCGRKAINPCEGVKLEGTAEGLFGSVSVMTTFSSNAFRLPMENNNNYYQNYNTFWIDCRQQRGQSSGRAKLLLKSFSCSIPSAPLERIPLHSLDGHFPEAGSAIGRVSRQRSRTSARTIGRGAHIGPEYRLEAYALSGKAGRLTYYGLKANRDSASHAVRIIVSAPKLPIVVDKRRNGWRPLNGNPGAHHRTILTLCRTGEGR